MKIYETLDCATAAANELTRETKRYWTAVPFGTGGWIVTDRYAVK